MLQYAQSLYNGDIIDVTGPSIIQNSFRFYDPIDSGVYEGGGVVDISVTWPGKYTVLYHEIEPLVRALRTAGFAAWARD